MGGGGGMGYSCGELNEAEGVEMEGGTYCFSLSFEMCFVQQGVSTLFVT